MPNFNPATREPSKMTGNKPLFFQRAAAMGMVCAALSAVPLGMSAAIAQESTVTKTTPSTTPAPAAPAPAPAAQPAPPVPTPAPEASTQAVPPASQTQAAAPQANPLGAGWSTKFGTNPPGGEFTNTPEQVAVIERLNSYFNNMVNLEGTFLQTDADDKRKKGRFYIERPGKLRFDYSLPSKQKIISDGKYLAIEDHDLNTTDRYPIESTPFRLLLTKNVDLLRDARIYSLDVGDNVAVVTLEDKNSDGGGQIRMFFEWPEVKLKEWIISDPQGLNTRIQVADLELNKSVKPDIFKFSPDVGMPKFTP
jgi:outer membrane lipoprotein-sorting protein